MSKAPGHDHDARTLGADFQDLRAALDRDAESRDALLTAACAGDKALRLDVDSLLRTQTAPALLDRSILGVVASLLDEPRTGA